MSGTAAHGARYEYGIELNVYAGGDYENRYSLEIKLNADGTDTAEWTKTYTDAAGRAYKTMYSDDTPETITDNPYSQSWYNAQGQLLERAGPGRGYHLLHLQLQGRAGIHDRGAERRHGGHQHLPDALRSSLSTLQSGTDRISQSVRSVISGSPNLVRNDTYAWQDGSSSGTLISRSDTSTDGLQSWQTQYRDVSTPVTNQTQTAYGQSGVRTVTSTAPDGSYSLTVYSNSLVQSVTRYPSSGSQVGRTTYGYDPHGRQNTLTDARNGTTTTTYNAADLVFTATTPNPGTPGGTPQTTTTYYNKMLQATNMQNPDATSAYTEYWLTGETKRNYGSRTYAVGYGYDYAGRLKTMTNWSNFGTGGGARVTTWNYDPYRGLARQQAVP